MRTVFAVDTDNFSYEGFVASPKLRFRSRRPPWRIEMQLGLEFADGDYHDYVYGVAPEYATQLRQEYRPNGGYAGVRFATGLNRYWGRFYVGAYARYTNIASAAFENSPLVATDHAMTAGLAVGWIFLHSETLVDADNGHSR